MSAAVLTHLSIARDPFGQDAACEFIAHTGETFGMTSEDNLVTCPDCILRLAGDDA